MSYVFQNIFWCLMAAALLGGIIGWLIKHLMGSSAVADLETSWKSRFGTLESERDRLAAAAKEHESGLLSWKTKCTGLEADHAKLKAEHEAASAKLPEMQGLVSDWTKRGSAWDSEKAKLAAELAAAVAAKAALDGQLTEWNSKSQAWSGERTKFSAEVEGWKRKHADLEKQLAKAVADDKADDSAYEKQITDLKAQLASSQGDLVAVKSKLDKAVADDKADDAVYQHQIAELKSQLTKSQSEHSSVRSLFDKSSADNKAASDVAQEQIADLRAQLAKAVADDKADDAAYQKQIADLRAQLAKSVADDKADDAAYEKRIAELDSQLKASAAMAATMVAGTEFNALKSRYDALASKPTEGDIERIEGIGTVYGQKLRAVGIAWVRQLLDQGENAEGRKRIAADTGIDGRLILTWVNAADLLRIDGVTPDWAELLEAAGVDTVKEIRNRIPENLLKKLVETNPNGPRGKYAPTLPELVDVETWIEQAKVMRVRVTH